MNYGLSHNVEKYQFVLIGNIGEGAVYFDQFIMFLFLQFVNPFYLLDTA